MPAPGTYPTQTPHLPPSVISLLCASLAPTTHRTHTAKLQGFLSFVPVASLLQPASPHLVLLYITALHHKGMQLVSIHSKLSPLSFWHQCNSWINPVEHFLVKKALLGVANLQPVSILVRISVSPLLLFRIFNCLGEIVLDSHWVTMFCFVFTLAFFAFLWLGEYTLSCHTLFEDDLVVSPWAIRITFSSYKFSKNHVSSILLQAIHFILCPVKALHNYWLIRPLHSGPIFLIHNSSPLTAPDVRSILR